jgi:hypothetical protein
VRWSPSNETYEGVKSGGIADFSLLQLMQSAVFRAGIASSSRSVFIRQGEESKPAARFTKFTKAAALRRSRKHAECVVIILECCRSPKFNCRVPSNVLRPRDSLSPCAGRNAK